MAEHFPNQGKETASRFIYIYNINKSSKVKGKDRLYEEAREKQLLIYKGIPKRLLAYFPAEKL